MRRATAVPRQPTNTFTELMDRPSVHGNRWTQTSGFLPAPGPQGGHPCVGSDTLVETEEARCAKQLMPGPGCAIGGDRTHRPEVFVRGADAGPAATGFDEGGGDGAEACFQRMMALTEIPQLCSLEFLTLWRSL